MNFAKGPCSMTVFSEDCKVTENILKLFYVLKSIYEKIIEMVFYRQ